MNSCSVGTKTGASSGTSNSNSSFLLSENELLSFDDDCKCDRMYDTCELADLVVAPAIGVQSSTHIESFELQLPQSFDAFAAFCSFNGKISNFGLTGALISTSSPEYLSGSVLMTLLQSPLLMFADVHSASESLGGSTFSTAAALVDDGAAATGVAVSAAGVAAGTIDAVSVATSDSGGTAFAEGADVGCVSSAHGDNTDPLWSGAFGSNSLSFLVIILLDNFTSLLRLRAYS